jgi:hypothetical protein
MAPAFAPMLSRHGAAVIGETAWHKIPAFGRAKNSQHGSPKSKRACPSGRKSLSSAAVHLLTMIGRMAPPWVPPRRRRTPAFRASAWPDSLPVRCRTGSPRVRGAARPLPPSGPVPPARLSPQPQPLRHLNLLSLRRDLSITIAWAPQARTFVGFHRVRHLSNTIAAHPLPPNHREPHSIGSQRSTTKMEAIDAWGARWQGSDRRSQSNVALQQSNGKFPPAIQGAKGEGRAIFSTLIRLITGHAFIGNYSARFRPDNPTDCPCGTPPPDS